MTIRQGHGTLVYAPSVEAYIATKNGVINISDDIVAGQVVRVVDGLSTFTLMVNNKRQKYTGKIARMDRVIIYLKKTRKVQVFAGYCSRVPAFDLYPTTARISGHCTLKRLMYTYWNPMLPASAELITQSTLPTFDQLSNDSGVAQNLYRVLTEVGNWHPNAIHIQNIPESWLQFAKTNAKLSNKDEVLAKLRAALGFSNASNPTSPPGAGTGNVGSEKSSDIGINPQPPQGYMGPLNTAIVAREAGFSGEDLVIAVAISGGESGYKAWIFSPPNDDGTIDRGLWQINTVHSQWSDEECKDPLMNAKMAYSLYKGRGNGFQDWTVYNSGAYRSHMQEAQAAVDQLVNVPPGLPGVRGQTGQDPRGQQQTQVGHGINIPPYGETSGSMFDRLQQYYGKWPDGVAANCVEDTFCGVSVTLHKIIWPLIKAIEKVVQSGSMPYKVKELSGFRRGSRVNGTTGDPDFHSFGVALDINWDQNPMVDNGTPTVGAFPPGGGTHDLPNDWVRTFAQYGFGWGGTWSGSRKDYMHFQFQGGIKNGVFKGNGVSVNIPTDGLTVQGGIATSGDPLENVVFNALFLQPQIQILGTDTAYGGELSLINSQQLLSTVTALSKAGLRSFMSGPNGDFIAFYPDYFGLHGNQTKFVLEDIEIKNFSIEASDDSLATHVFTAGDNLMTFGPVTYAEWLNTSGVVTIEQKDIFENLLGIHGNSDYSASAIYERFGARPMKAEFPQIRSGVFEYFQALHLFMRAWASQYSTAIDLTFMPELFPGMRMELGGRGIAVYVEQVIHNFSYADGFNTQAVVSSPSRSTGEGAGLPLELEGV